MKRTRIALVSLFSAVALALVAVPAAAQPSATAELINELNGKLLYLGIPITLLVEVILIYTVIKFRNNDDPQPTKENRRLEITWTVATAIILLFVGVASYGVLANPNVTYAEEPGAQAPGEGDSVLVHAEAYQWGWEFTYPEENVTVDGSEASPVVIPAEQDIYFEVTSRDVIHAFHVPEMGLKIDAFPGQNQTIKTVAHYQENENNVYQGYCAEFCGVAHSQMYFQVKVVPQDEYEQWLQEQSSGSDSGGSGNDSGNASNASAVGAQAELTAAEH
ncbi:cytochrome c oxidase subunit II [Haloprofundus sp. MHR1]|uniref:cytochrome c oxidase subunit II n=1 Tax=Haloprofundus sp. MHR1 TaxID=2572921 RepID=UPI0010BE9954|nr:cytochrome c oxidase subunit II [Haloprofundus sp. MHR1]QCJ47933.1 cytochrome c oxidase subunit II [Haloprofundus sp. MHR1]